MTFDQGSTDFGVMLGSLWGHFGVTLGSRWGLLGLVLGGLTPLTAAAIPESRLGGVNPPQQQLPFWALGGLTPPAYC